MTSVGIRRGDLHAVAPTRSAPVQTTARRVRPWSQWLAAAAVVAPGGGLAMRLAATDGERAPIQGAGATGSP